MLLPNCTKSTSSDNTRSNSVPPSIQGSIRHINCVTHEGKVVLVGTDEGGKLWYTIKQDGFEDSYLNQEPEARTGWENWQLLELPNEDNDQSVIDKEKEEFTIDEAKSVYLLRSRYKTHDQSAVAPVQLVSGLGYIYVFRQSKSNTLFVDRFVLDGLTNTLNRKLDVRFKRSRQKHKPIQKQRQGESGLLNADALDFVDIQGNPFYEPTTELSLIRDLKDGWFSVVLLPTQEQDKYRWHIFAYNSQTQTVEVTTLRASEEGLFDVKDYTILDPEPRNISGIIKRTLNLGSNITVSKGIAATRYNVQRERDTQAKDKDGNFIRQLLRESVRVMLVVGTSRGNIVTLSFAVAPDGTLSKIADRESEKKICRSMSRQVLLPPNTLKDLQKKSQENRNREGITLDGVDDYIALPPMNHDFSQGLTVEAWICFNSLKPKSRIIDFGNGADAENIVFGSGNTATDLRFSIGRDYDLKLIASGGAGALPKEGKRLIAIAKDNQNKNQLSLRIFDVQGSVFNWQEATALQVDSLKIEALKTILKSYWNTHESMIPQEDNKRIVAAVRAILPTQTSPILTQDRQNIDAPGILESGKWIHVAATIDADGKTTLYKNGQQIKTETLKLPPIVNRTQNYIGKSNSGSDGYFNGKLSDVRLWNRACTADEIKNSLPLRGNEAGLVGYWRLDVIAEGKFIDFSPNGNDGTVKGGAYVSSGTLERNLQGTATAIEYINEDLFAVSERATYTEEFEFKPNGTVSALTFIYKGKKSRSSQDWIEITASSTQITPLDNNWYKASSSFTVPDGVSLVRSFGIGNIQGNWTQLEIRKHRITLVCDSITVETYNDNLNDKLQLQGSATPQSIQRTSLQRLTSLEQAEAVLLLRQQALERAKRQNQSSAVAGTNLSAEIAASETRVQNLQNEVNTLQSQYNNLVNNPFSDWCYIVAKHSERCIQALDNQQSNGAGIKQGVIYDPSSLVVRGMWTIQWKFEPGDNGYKIVNRYGGYNTKLCLHISGSDKNANHARIDQYTDANVNWQRWIVNRNSDGSYSICSKHVPTKGFDVSGISYDDGGVIQLYPWSLADSCNWRIENIKTEDKKRERNAKNAELENEKTNLQRLKDRQDNETKLTAVNNQLQVVRNEIQGLNLASSAPVEMRVIATDDRKLTTQGAVLDFVRPASRLSAIETCEGNVQLSYFDEQGRMRQTNFDATADSKNTTFEEWLPDTQRTCLKFGLMFDSGSPVPSADGSIRLRSSCVVSLKQPIHLNTEWTIEAWFFYPFLTLDDDLITVYVSRHNKWITLYFPIFSEYSIRQPIVIRDGKYLGTTVDDRFYNSGYNLENLAVGWHHLTAVGKGSDTNTTTVFYIDGKEVGKTVSTAALVLDGTDDVLDCGNKIDLNGKSFTIELWAKLTAPTTPNQDQIILFQGSEQQNKGLNIGFSSNNKFRFSFYDNNLDTPDSYTDTGWHHWACVYDDKTQKRQIYCDGKKVTEDPTRLTNKYSGTGNLFAGKSWNNPHFKGQINELRIWNRPFTEDEIAANWDKTLTSNDSALLGWWQFSAKEGKAEVRDRSAQNATASFKGDPRIESSSAAIAIDSLGNSFMTQKALVWGKLAEIRVWKVALTKEEIEVNSKTQLTGNEPGLVAYYPLNEATGTAVKNQTGDGNDGTISGASWEVCAVPIGSLRPPTIQFSDPPLVLQINEPIIQFDGKDDFIRLPLTGGSLSADFTVEAWIKPSELGSKDLSILGTDTDQNNKGLHLVIRNKKAHFGFYNNDTTGTKELSADTWYHISFRYSKTNQEQAIFINGELDNKSQQSRSPFQGTDALKIGSSLGERFFKGCIAEVRIWNKALTPAEIQARRYQRLTGTEPGLIAYYPLNGITLEGSTSKVTDLKNNNHGTVNGATLVNEIADAAISCEYSTVSKDKSAMMRRFLAAPSLQGVHLLPDKRIEQLELQWIGNGQFAPTLLGYIEGAPPIPSENLTLEDNYNGATSVELALSEDVEFKWTRSQDSGFGYQGELFAGLDVELSAGVAITKKILSTRSGYKGNLETGYQFQNESSIASSSSLSMTDKLQLSGTQEQEAYFPHLGKRFIPKNVGYALVISALADVFITRLKRSSKMVGYQVLPVENIPPDINTITFLINPAYTMSGSLDGMTGSSATSQRFFKHVPEMRSRFGSLYPASYYRLQEAYDLKQKIEQQDKDREAYFSNFNSRLLDETSLGQEIDKGNTPGEIAVKREEDKPDDSFKDDQKKTSEEQEKARKLQQEAKAAQDKQSEEVKKKQAEIDKQIKDPNLRANAATSFARWQKRMETIQIRSGKRNIVNSYVWDADGGLRAEAQSFANTAEHSIGGSFSMNAALGWEEKLHVGAIAIELTAQATVNLTQTMSKTETRSKGIQLNVDLSGVESRGITNYDDLPLLPGEKVNRYRFMSFYLEGSTNNFNDFFSYVVDPEWLAGNSEEARALRQAKGKANKAWRVLHRVTYVERPALMGFGRDIRQLPPAVSQEDQIALLKEKVANIEKANAAMELKLDEIWKLLKEEKKA
ncbi:RICIN domain-containing protein [Calothrix sp. FACHB-1219]|uniref:LamG-like jellyroll fold domain-containing protein n=1 Tax=unclassified Calothrix TaxID=2619626 RepID=UPI0016888666|nr:MULTISPECIES: LamG-like jellyroll fold domain-containing protein [unclassified Calothrix]MBD2203270.1 RICIN domain-containing protein [Calothrix sp. FACHB-168]MBD2216434.1 RICIN domain-containing protein [Calothrix sp. FACHB-1219]